MHVLVSLFVISKAVKINFIFQTKSCIIYLQGTTGQTQMHNAHISVSLLKERLAWANPYTQLSQALKGTEPGLWIAGRSSHAPKLRRSPEERQVDNYLNWDVLQNSNHELRVDICLLYIKSTAHSLIAPLQFVWTQIFAEVLSLAVFWNKV